MKTKNEQLPTGTILNDGVVKADGTVEPFRKASEIMTELEVAELKRRADAAKDVPVTVVKVDSPTLDEGKISLIKANSVLHAKIVEKTELALVDDRDLSIKPMFNEEQIALLKARKAPNATQAEFQQFLYMSQITQLDPMLNEIWLVKFGDSPAQIYAGRDGFLKIAHRSGHFDGMETVVHFDDNGKPINAVCTVWRNDMTHPFKSDVLFKEYTTGKALWTSKPAVMIGKVAESVCLRKAFSVSGLYSPEEMG